MSDLEFVNRKRRPLSGHKSKKATPTGEQRMKLPGWINLRLRNRKNGQWMIHFERKGPSSFTVRKCFIRYSCTVPASLQCGSGITTVPLHCGELPICRCPRDSRVSRHRRALMRESETSDRWT
jgi:hypothetical protein